MTSGLVSQKFMSDIVTLLGTAIALTVSLSIDKALEASAREITRKITGEPTSELLAAWLHVLVIGVFAGCALYVMYNKFKLSLYRK
jgi:hypothetical protein